MQQTIDKIKDKLKDNLVSAVRFGAEGQPKNLLFVLDKLGIDVLDSVRDIVVNHSKKENVVPLFFTKEELVSGADVFPLEFINIKYSHEVLHGEDVIAQIKFEKRHVRRQLEFELRSKRIHLRENYIWIKKPAELREVILAAVPSLTPLFYGLLFIKEQEPSVKLEDMFEDVAKLYKVDVGILEKIKAMKEKKVKGSAEELDGYAKELVGFLDKLTGIVDSMKF